MSVYGECECGCPLAASWFLEEEYEVLPGGGQYKTGRVRRAVSHLYCPDCWRNYCVDDSFDGQWYYKT